VEKGWLNSLHLFASFSPVPLANKGTKMIYTVYVALVLVAFLMVLNGFLRGVKKAHIDAVLSLLLIGLLITAFLVAGWQVGLLTVTITFISAIVTRPIAARLASRLFAVSGGGGGYVGLPSPPSPKNLPTTRETN